MKASVRQAHPRRMRKPDAPPEAIEAVEIVGVVGIVGVALAAAVGVADRVGAVLAPDPIEVALAAGGSAAAKIAEAQMFRVA